MSRSTISDASFTTACEEQLPQRASQRTAPHPHWLPPSVLAQNRQRAAAAKMPAEKPDTTTTSAAAAAGATTTPPPPETHLPPSARAPHPHWLTSTPAPAAHLTTQRRPLPILTIPRSQPPPTAQQARAPLRPRRSARARAPLPPVFERKDEWEEDDDGASDDSAKTTASRRMRRMQSDWVRVGEEREAASEAWEEVREGETDVGVWEDEEREREVEEDRGGEDEEWEEVREEDAERWEGLSVKAFVGTLWKALVKMQ